METDLRQEISAERWRNSTRKDYSTLHQIAPYIGKMKPIMAKELIQTFTNEKDTICDPYVGSGTIALEAIIEGRNIICNDVNPYAYTLTKAKIDPPPSLVSAKEKVKKYLSIIDENPFQKDLTQIPNWVQDFFHPQTLRETLFLAELLKNNDEHFLLACLLGILHHQRPGFLSYPASNLVPYLRTKKFPRDEYPEMYEYREIKPRLLSKIDRVYKRFPEINYSLRRECYLKTSNNLENQNIKLDAIITSPPYMNNLDYARDNRLRLWFLGVEEYKPLDDGIKNEELFKQLILDTFTTLKSKLKPKGKLILVLGNKNKKKKIVESVERLIIEEVGDFDYINKIDDEIPDIKRSRKNKRGTKKEWIMLFIKNK